MVKFSPQKSFFVTEFTDCHRLVPPPPKVYFDETTMLNQHRRDIIAVYRAMHTTEP
jgi:hypothetical protein